MFTNLDLNGFPVVSVVIVNWNRYEHMIRQYV